MASALPSHSWAVRLQRGGIAARSVAKGRVSRNRIQWSLLKRMPRRRGRGSDSVTDKGRGGRESEGGATPLRAAARGGRRVWRK